MSVRAVCTLGLCDQIGFLPHPKNVLVGNWPLQTALWCSEGGSERRVDRHARGNKLQGYRVTKIEVKVGLVRMHPGKDPLD